MKTNKPKPLKSYVMKLYDTEALATFQEFQNLVVYKNTTVTDAILSMCSDFVNKNNPSDCFLVTELELLTFAKSLDIKVVSRSSLRKYKQLGILNGLWFTNEDGNIVYDRDGVINFLKQRSTSPFSRLKTKDEK